MKRKPSVLMLVFLLAMFTTSHQIFAAHAPVGNRNLEGYVIDAKTNSPIAGAKVIVTDMSEVTAFTDWFGFYVFTLPPGPHNLAVEVPGYIPKMAGVNVPPLGEGIARLDFALTPGQGYFIIVAGRSFLGGLENQINYGCNQVFRILRGAGYNGDRIYYLSFNSPQDVDGDGINDIDDTSSSSNLQWAIDTWAAQRCSFSEPLFLYLFDHGSVDSFNINWFDEVTSVQLMTWFDNLEAARSGTPIYTIYAPCHSGSFIDDLSRTGRLIITSCQENQDSYLDPSGTWEAFSLPFWRQIQSGHSVAWAFNRACQVVSQIGNPQTPLLDDNGDNIGHTSPIPHGGDGWIAERLYIEHSEWVYPWIKGVVAKQSFSWPPPPVVTLWAEINNKTSLLHVRAWMRPPVWSPQTGNNTLLPLGFECFEMSDPDNDGNFTVEIPAVNFTSHTSGSSEFRFIITAQEENEETAIPMVTGVEFFEDLPAEDNATPFVNIERPIDWQTVQGRININGTSTDDVCLERINLYSEGRLIASLDPPSASSSFFDFNFDTSTISNGSTSILVEAVDTSGNEGTQSLNIVVNNTASPTIYIRADGSINPPTAPITTTDNVTYTFTGNINDSIVVERNNIIIDGTDCTLQGTRSGRGIDLSSRSNIKIKNTDIKNFFHGVYLDLSYNNTIYGNNITNNYAGVCLYSSSDNDIYGNEITNNIYGFSLHFSSNNRFYHNNFINNTNHVTLHDYSNFWDNDCEGNYWSDYNGTDADHDGIGDTPYIIDENNTDRYPLMNPYWNPGDIDHDLDVDLFDAVRLLLAYGSKLGSENYNCHCDINEPYGAIDLFDAVLLLLNYGKQYS